MKVLHILRLVMYIDSKCFTHKLKGDRWTPGNHIFWLKLCRFITEHGGEDIKVPMLIHQKVHHNLRWDFEKHMKLTFSQVMRKDYKTYLYDEGTCGLAIVRGVTADFEKMYKKEDFLKNVAEFQKREKLVLFSIGCYDDSNARKFIIFSKNTKLLA